MGQLLKPLQPLCPPSILGQFSCHSGLTQALRHTLQHTLRLYSSFILSFKEFTSSGKPSGPPGKKNLTLVSVPCFLSCCLVIALLTQFLVIFGVSLFCDVVCSLSRGPVFPTGPSTVCYQRRCLINVYSINGMNQGSRSGLEHLLRTTSWPHSSCPREATSLVEHLSLLQQHWHHA